MDIKKNVDVLINDLTKLNKLQRKIMSEYNKLQGIKFHAPANEVMEWLESDDISEFEICKFDSFDNVFIVRGCDDKGYFSPLDLLTKLNKTLQ